MSNDIPYNSARDSLQMLLEDFYSETRNQRFGQWFVCKYIKGSWPELFYEECLKISIDKVDQWLMDNAYMHSLPPEVRKLGEL